MWVGAEETPILFVNMVASQFDNNDGFIVSMGQLTPPALQGSTPEAIREQAEKVGFVYVKPAARLGMTRAQMMDTIAVLQANVDQYDRAQDAKPGDPR